MTGTSATRATTAPSFSLVSSQRCRCGVLWLRSARRLSAPSLAGRGKHAEHYLVQRVANRPAVAETRSVLPFLAGSAAQCGTHAHTHSWCDCAAGFSISARWDLEGVSVLRYPTHSCVWLTRCPSEKAPYDPLKWFTRGAEGGIDAKCDCVLARARVSAAAVAAVRALLCRVCAGSRLPPSTTTCR